MNRLKHIKIRTRIMLWYIFLTAVLLAVSLPLLYHLIAGSLLDSEKNDLEAIMARVVANIGFDSGLLTVPDTINVPPGVLVVVWDEKNGIAYTNSEETWADRYAFMPDAIQQVRYSDDDWLIGDAVVKNDGLRVAGIRICYSLEGMERALLKTLLSILAMLPIFLIIAIAGGLIISRRALRPVSSMTELAREIRLGDMSKRITNVISEDEVGELAGTFNDMLDALEESFEKEKRFASDVSHELRTPVSVIMANTETALEGDLNQDARKSLEEILIESKRMNTIISQLLMLTRGVEGKYKLIPEPLNIKTVINAVMEQLDETAESQRIDLLNETSDDVIISADQSLVTQMMLNLISNAIKYGKQNGYVRAKAWLEGNGCFIVIADDGAGIEPDDISHIFERFYRSDPSRDRTGSGLGLSIVKWIVDEHRGSITVESKPGSGSVFKVWMPR